MDAAEELQVCCHCNKEVAKTNFPIHEAHCERFLFICPDCEEPVPKNQLEEHREEQHTLIKCTKCNVKMEKRKLPDHEENECKERLQSCEYCQLDVRWSNLKEHVDVCGSRTERCQDCNQYVILKDQLTHAQICTSDNISFKTKSINGNVKPPAVNLLQENKASNAEPKDMTLSLSDLQKKKWNEKINCRDDNPISSCPHCHLALPVNVLQWHEGKCRLAEGLKQMSVGKEAKVKQ